MLHWVGYLVIVAAIPVLASIVEELAAKWETSVFGLKARHRRLVFRFGLVLVVVAWLAYVSRFIVHDTTLKEVAENTSRGMSLFFLLGASWAGGTGSIFLFTMLLAVIAAATLGRVPEKRVGDYIVLQGLAILFGLAYLVASGGLDYTEGFAAGLNPLLKSFWLYPHPLSTFIAYAFTVSAAIAATVEAWRVARILAGIGWMALTAGIVLGGVWSYMTFGWGGYWAWDPVETSELLPWLILTAYMHVSSIKSSRPLLGAAAASVFFAIFMVRTGLSPLHSFAAATLANLSMLIPFLLFAAYSFRETPKLANMLVDMLSSHNPSKVSLAVIVLALVYAHAVVFASLAIPAAIHLTGAEASVPQGAAGVAFYHPLLYPALIMLLASMPACLLSLSNMRVWLAGVASAAFAGTVLALMTVYGRIVWSPLGSQETNVMISFGLPLAGLALGSTIYALLNAVKRKLAITVAKNMLHLGLVLLVIGVFFSGSYAFNEAYLIEVTVKPGETIKIGDISLKLTSYEYRITHDRHIDTYAYAMSAPVIYGTQALAVLSHVYQLVNEASTKGATILEQLDLIGLVDVGGANTKASAPALITATTHGNISVECDRITLEALEQQPQEKGLAVPVCVGTIRLNASNVILSESQPITLDFTKPLTLNVNGYTIACNAAIVHLMDIYSVAPTLPHGKMPRMAKINRTESMIVASPVTMICLNGTLKTPTGREYKVPVEIPRDAATYIALKSSPANTIYKILASNPDITEALKDPHMRRLIAALFHTRMGSARPPIEKILPEKVPETVEMVLNLRVSVGGREHDVRVVLRFDGHGELAGIHGLVVQVIPIPEGLDDIYLAIHPPIDTNSTYGWHDLLLYYLNKTLARVEDRLQKLGIVAAFATGYLIDLVRQSPQNMLNQLAHAIVELYDKATHYQSAVETSGVKVAVKYIPMVNLVWLGSAIMIASEAATLIATTLRERKTMQTRNR